jgi:hypothetical protein
VAAPANQFNLVFIFGPPAVGKMTVGQELGRLTGYKLLYNHMTIDPIIEIFEFGSPSFKRLVPEFRRAIVREAARIGLPGLIFTFVWNFDEAACRVFLDEIRDIVLEYGGLVHYAELEATLDERLIRNRSENRMQHKKPMRDPDATHAWVIEDEHIRNTSEERPFPYTDKHIKIDNTSMSPSEAGRRIAERFSLPIVV